MCRWKEAAKLETEATWLEVCRIDSPLERLAAALTMKQSREHPVPLLAVQSASNLWIGAG